ncbi:uncharacterized protein LOC131254261 [Magnolia sinica]|uniref:uncharacterized protein LOC131254261 n=1 Tax=Magnolia sinica TaxID=86752 RepID=UPI0026589D45|nr:uncharacterized protein LOC131254261 [Magnolia sinica]
MQLVAAALKNHQPAAIPVSEQSDLPRASTIFREFRQHDPPRFKGELDPFVVEVWHTKIARIFYTIQCPTDQRVSLATFLLLGEARHWWSSVMGGPYFVWTCEEFMVQKFFPEHVRERRAMEFETLVQGDMTVSQYEARFLELSRFVPHLTGDEKMRARYFQNDWASEARLPSPLTAAEATIIASSSSSSASAVVASVASAASSSRS